MKEVQHKQAADALAELLGFFGSGAGTMEGADLAKNINSPGLKLGSTAEQVSAPYIEGFTAKCAEYGVNPVELVGSVKQGSSALNKMIRRSIAAGNRRLIEDSELWGLINRLSLRGDAGGAARGIQRKFHDIAQGVSHGKPSASRIESSQSSPALQALKSLGSPEDLQSLSPRITQ